jgi:hypothetical protein
VGQFVIVKSFCVAIAVVAAAVAPSATSSTSPSASFEVSVRGTILQIAEYQQQNPQGECAYVYGGRWHVQLDFRSARPTRMVVSRRDGKLRFSRPSLVAVRGTQTTRGAGVARAPGCEDVVVDCFIHPDSFRGGSIAVAPGRGVITLGPLRHGGLRPACGNPGRVGARSVRIQSEPARIPPNFLRRRRVVVQSAWSTTEPLGPPEVDSGLFYTRISWTITFVRVRP